MQNSSLRRSRLVLVLNSAPRGRPLKLRTQGSGSHIKRTEARCQKKSHSTHLCILPCPPKVPGWRCVHTSWLAGVAEDCCRRHLNARTSMTIYWGYSSVGVLLQSAPYPIFWTTCAAFARTNGGKTGTVVRPVKLPPWQSSPLQQVSQSALGNRCWSIGTYNLSKQKASLQKTAIWAECPSTTYG